MPASTSGLTRSARRRHVARGGELGELLALFLGFEVELADAGVERADQLPVLLAHAREHDVLGRHARGERAGELAARDDVGAEAFALHHAEHREVGVGLDREREVRAAQRSQRFAEHAGVALERGARIDVDGVPTSSAMRASGTSSA